MEITSSSHSNRGKYFLIWMMCAVTAGRWLTESAMSAFGVLSLVLSLMIVIVAAESFRIFITRSLHRHLRPTTRSSGSLTAIEGALTAVLVALFLGIVPAGMIWRDAPAYTAGVLAVISLSTLFVILPHIALRRREKLGARGSWTPLALLMAIILYYISGIVCVVVSVAGAFVSEPALGRICALAYASPFIGYCYGILFLLSGSILLYFIPRSPEGRSVHVKEG